MRIAWLILDVSKFFSKIGNYFYTKHVKRIRNRQEGRL
jgi:hypothetical protein